MAPALSETMKLAAGPRNNSGSLSSTINPPDSCFIGSIDTLPIVKRPSEFATSGQRRSLRSQDGNLKLKSELSLYFPRYEQILSLEPAKKEFLSTGSKIILTDDITSNELPASLAIRPYTRPLRQQEHGLSETRFSGRGSKNPLTNLHDAHIIDSLPPFVPCDQTKDPLSRELYFTAHRRIERKEKQLRNIEKERAQHEKVQLDRLLSALQGHDWLRVMGVSGITESEKRLYEPKRTYFIMEVSALLQKFKLWKREEKRRKAEKERFATYWTPDECAENHVMSADERDAGPADVSAHQSAVKAIHLPGPHGESSAPGTDDIDAWAAHQLHQEAMSALPENRRKSGSKLMPSGDRSLALNTHTTRKDPLATKSRSTATTPCANHPAEGSSVTRKTRMASSQAFGQPIPAILRNAFRLSPCILTEEAIRDCRRRNRRRRRDHMQGGMDT